MKYLIAFIFGAGFLFGCNNPTSQTNKTDVLADHLDTIVKPGDDIFMYANGGWIKTHPIPGEESQWGIGNLVVEENARRLREISESAAKEKAARGTASQKIGDFWETAMDTIQIEKDGVKPLQPYLDKIAAISDPKSLQVAFAEFDQLGIKGLIDFNVWQDEKNSELNALHAWQSGIGLPEREYYFKTDASTVNIRSAYLKNIGNILVMLGDDPSKAKLAAADILSMETRLAKVSRKLEDLRDPYANYNKMAIGDLSKLSTLVNWNNYMQANGIGKTDSVIVGQPEYYKAVDKVLQNTSMDTWKSLMRYRLVKRFAEMLPDKFGIETFEFSKLFSGAKERKPRWKRVIRAEENAMGEVLGQLYVKEFFNEKAKKRYEDMVDAVKTAYGERIKKLSWMSDSTKQKALIKLASVKKKVGFPDKWKDFSAMEIGKESYLQNAVNAAKWWHHYEMNKLGKPVDRDDWDMTPQTYNAYYNASNNEIVLPAGIFTVPGYKDEELDDATVYGYGGASTIGHEITHGFDDEGRQFDEKGNLKSWWTKNDEAEFKKRADVMVSQFNKFEPLPGSYINGKATLGENIADLGGILIGLDAFKQTDQYKKNEKIAGLNPLQRYFLGYALGWMAYPTEQSLKNQLMTDVHSPAKYRVNGPFVNVPEFYTAFGIVPTDKIYMADSSRVNIW
ncbi:MAG: metalloendopeptidase [Ferruginibacter sp.]|nr:metalloendopeptidase [Ferruginibacter sp.]